MLASYTFVSCLRRVILLSRRLRLEGPRSKGNSPAGNAMAQQLADVLHPLPVAALGVLLRSRSGETDRQQLGDRGG